MESDELEYIEDSEPERWEQQQRRTSGGSFPRSSPEAASDDEQETIVIPESPTSPHASTSRFFVAPTSPTKRRRPPDPHLLGARTTSVSPPPLSRKISLSALQDDYTPAPTEPLPFPPAAQPHSSHTRADSLESTTSNSSIKTKRKSDPSVLGEKKPKKRHSQITSAAALLREEKPKKGRSAEAVVVQAKKEKAVKRLSITSGSSVEIEIEEEEVDADVSISSDGIVVPPRLTSSKFHRELYGLPPLVVKEVKPKVEVRVKEKSRSKGKGKAKEESDASSEEEDDTEMTAADRLRGGLSKFKYGSASTNDKPKSSKSTSRSTSVEDKEKPTLASSSRLKSEASFPPPPPLTLPSDDRLKVLDGCPLCSNSWTTHKTPSSKAVHLRKCAFTQDYTTETVRILIERRILDLAHRVELEQREVGMRRTAPSNPPNSLDSTSKRGRRR
ncbi:hypothetical protein BCR35DRAFT_189534 [Leucosporidium creatinivorum]|uniref:Uncharacterized protein n=1 Tax=Leucosporidium creatinivorum TaxID=106004 RepID=A0A1Y2FY46_9BASI|nr:hypothetical protein BCR35DRAFT_189534 [Leucosporidium creatinivorum]